jgi:hypothetical protein
MHNGHYKQDGGSLFAVSSVSEMKLKWSLFLLMSKVRDGGDTDTFPGHHSSS